MASLLKNELTETHKMYWSYNFYIYHFYALTDDHSEIVLKTDMI